MSLTGKNNEEKIWNFLTGKGLNSYGAAGLMGNLFAESGLNPHNLQNTYEKKLGYTDDDYTDAVDSGKYTGFVLRPRAVDILEPQGGTPELCQGCRCLDRRSGDSARLPLERTRRKLRRGAGRAEKSHQRETSFRRRAAQI